MTTITAQPGPQTMFMQSAADIAIYGGAAGGGKTLALLLEPLRHIDKPRFAAVFFRRTTVQIDNPGGLWDAAGSLYPHLSGRPIKHVHVWRFPTGAIIKMSHLERDVDALNWQGSEIPLICWDELTHFTAKQFWYLVSRNRSTIGIRPYIRATTNPDADSWVADFIAWWIDPVTGFPIPERSGVLRWFVRVNESIMWADRQEDLAHYTMQAENGTTMSIPAKSLTFIAAKLHDNAILMQSDPGYLANLLAMPRVERERLLGGNWLVRASAGLMFKRHWCEIIDTIPARTIFKRGWDLGATEKTETNDPDFTASTKIGRMPDGRFVVADHFRFQGSPGAVETTLFNTATQDGRACEQNIPQDPGQAGKSQVAHFIRRLAGFNVRATPETGDKVTRFGPFSAQAEATNVVVLRGPWNEQWFSALEGFPEQKHDDDADATSRAFNAHMSPGPMRISDAAIAAARR